MPRPRVQAVAFVACLALIAASCSSDSTDTSDGGGSDASELTLSALSAPAEFVSGGDLLVGVTPSISSEADIVVTSDGETLSSEIRTSPDGGDTHLFVSSIPKGSSTLSVETGGSTATLDVTSHDDGEPVFSGPHVPMPVCTTERFDLGPPQDDDCFAESRIFWDEVEGNSSVTGRTEVGVINRGVYSITMPTDGPSATEGEIDLSRWNGRLVYQFGGGCGTTYSQGFTMSDGPNAELLAQGYAFATSTLNTLQVQCNTVLSAETMLRVKEHFIETYGVPDLTIGAGGSGGAIQQLSIAQNYPGLLDAIGPTVPFPDAVSISGGVVDCALLNNYYRTAGTELSVDQKVAINGHLTAGTCDSWEQTFVPGIDPSRCGFGDVISQFESALPGLEGGMPEPDEADIYDAETNPEGLRCTLQDSNVNIYGSNPDTGFANRAWDNVGIQYGLGALSNGDLTFDEFADLNEKIGSFDIDGQLQDVRAEADEVALTTAYETGQVLSGGGGLNDIPIIAVNVYTDPEGDIHDRWRIFSIAERVGGQGADQSPSLGLWTVDLPTGESLVDSLTGAVNVGPKLVNVLDEWATALQEGGGDPSAEAFEQSRPDQALNSCFAADGTELASGPDVYTDGGGCDTYPVEGDPRTVSGADLSSSVVKCQLVSVEDAAAADTYPESLTDAQADRLGEIFPDGVCDWTEPGVGQVPLGDTWHDYGG